MNNECENCIMFNCCDEMSASCEEVKFYGKAIKEKVIKDFAEKLWYEMNWQYRQNGGLSLDSISRIIEEMEDEE